LEHFSAANFTHHRATSSSDQNLYNINPIAQSKVEVSVRDRKRQAVNGEDGRQKLPSLVNPLLTVLARVRHQQSVPARNVRLTDRWMQCIT
jgi:hypothetical protein